MLLSDMLLWPHHELKGTPRTFTVLVVPQKSHQFASPCQALAEAQDAYRKQLSAELPLCQNFGLFQKFRLAALQPNGCTCQEDTPRWCARAVGIPVVV